MTISDLNKFVWDVLGLRGSTKCITCEVGFTPEMVHSSIRGNSRTKQTDICLDDMKVYFFNFLNSMVVWEEKKRGT